MVTFSEKVIKLGSLLMMEEAVHVVLVEPEDEIQKVCRTIPGYTRDVG